MIDRNHPAVEAANKAVKRAYGSRGGEALNYHATALRAALPHLTADDLRHTPAGRALMAEAWDDGYITGESDGWRNRDDPGSLVEEGGSHNPYREETPNE